MPGIRLVESRRRHAHAGQSETHGERQSARRRHSQATRYRPWRSPETDGAPEAAGDAAAAGVGAASATVTCTTGDITGGIMRNVSGVAEQDLQRVFAGRQRDRRLCLAGAVMQVIFVVRDRLVERRQVGVDQQMEMPAVGFGDAGGRDAHPRQPEMNGRGGRDRRAVLEIDEIGLRAGRRWRSAPAYPASAPWRPRERPPSTENPTAPI